MSESKPAIKTAKRVSFSEDTKSHDGLTPSTQLFDLLMINYLSIGGMHNVHEMTTFLESKDSSVDIPRREELLSMGERLLSRIEESEGGVPILPIGGGSNCKVPKDIIPNLKHMLIVLKIELETKKT